METSINIPQSNQTLRDNALRITLSFVGWLTLSIVAGWISRYFIPKVRAMEAKDQVLWRLAIARFLFGPAPLLGAYMIYVDGRIAIDYVLASTDESWTWVSIIAGFFVFEELTLIYSDIKYKMFSKELHVHHFFTLNGFFGSAYYNRAHYYAAKMFILQISTPFTCICWCLLKLKLEKSKAWKINQWILIYIFHTRTIIELSLWYDFYHDWNNIKENLPWPYAINMMTGLATLTIWLTPYWTYRKTIQYFYPNYWYEKDKKKQQDELLKTS